MDIDKRKSCPGGSHISYPIGTIKKVKMGDPNCKNCPLYKQEGEEENCNFSGK